MSTFSTFIQCEKEDVKEFSRIGGNTARTYSQTSSNIASGGTSKITVARTIYCFEVIWQTNSAGQVLVDGVAPQCHID